MATISVSSVYSVVNDLKILFVFLDGFGIGADDPAVNPLRDPRYPKLQALLDGATPIDATLGVPGKPQSASGQTTMLTGVNAAEVMGRHVEGFPTHTLKKLIEKENLFTKLRALGKDATFANSYWIDDPESIPSRRRSVTTVMTLAALGGVRHKQELLDGLAVNHDITRWTMHTRGYDGPHITEEEAAGHLLDIAERHDFTLYEYFLTDRAGHSGEPEQVHQCLATLERFVPAVAQFAEQPNHLFLVCSDHGNIEDNTSTTHSMNPIPLIALGDGAETFRNATSLLDVTPTILQLYQA